MRLAVVPFIVLAASLALAAEAPNPDPCAVWNLLGYRIGMTRDEAQSLHGGEFRKKTISRFPPNGKPYSRKYAELHADIAPPRNAYRPDPKWYDPELIVRFEATGGAFAILMTPEHDAGKTKLELIRRFGPPFADGLESAPDGSPFGSRSSTRTLWESEACGADLYLVVTRSRSGNIEDAETRVILVHHGGHYEFR